MKYIYLSKKYPQLYKIVPIKSNYNFYFYKNFYLMKRILIIFLIISFISPIIYDTLINGNLEKIYTKKETYTQIIFFIKKISKNFEYFEIINFYGKITIQKNSEIIGELDEGENSFYFKHDGISNYYMIFKFPVNFKKCGFKVSSNFKEYNYILNSYLSLPFLNKRKFNITINNKEQNTQLISIKISKTIPIGIYDKVYMEENGKKFIPISKSNEKYIYYYALIKNKLTLEINLYNLYEEKTLINYVDIYLNYEKIETISNNTTLCLNNNININFYKIKLEKNNTNFNYELSIIKSSKLYLIKNNTNIKELKSNIIYNNTNLENGILILDSFENNGCFNINFIYEKKNNILNNDIKDLKIFYNKNILSSKYEQQEQEQNIENDYFECVKTTKRFLLIPNSQKKVIRFTTSSYYKTIELDGITNLYYENKFNLTQKKYLIVKGTTTEPIYINILYLKKDKFEIILNKKMYFNVVYKRETFEFDSNDIKTIDYIITFTAKSIKNDIEFVRYKINILKELEYEIEPKDVKYIEFETKKYNDGFGEIEIYFYTEKYRMHLFMYYTAIILSILTIFLLSRIFCYTADKVDSCNKFLFVFCHKRNKNILY